MCPVSLHTAISSDIWSQVRWSHMVPMHKAGISSIFTHSCIFRHLESGQIGSYGTLAQSWNILYLCTQLYLQTPGVRSDGVILYPCTKLEYPYFYTQLYLQTYGVRGDGVMLYPCTKLVCPVSLHTYIILFRYLESGQIGSYCALAQSWMSCICTSSHLESACPHSL